MQMKKVLKFVLGGFILLVVIAAIAGGSKSHTATPTKVAAVPPAQVIPPQTSDATSSDRAQPTTTPTTPAPAPAPASQPTAGEQNALQSAQNYLSEGQGFSRAGLIQQLSSSSGEGFSQSDATWAVDHAGADWNQQAVESAKNYMSDGQGFSKSDLIQQLTSSSGEGFTLAQAQYAVGVVYH
jgi:hypothetical protein